MTRAEAIAFLRERYDQQAQRWPLLRKIPKDLYVRRNLKAAMALSGEISDD